MGQKTSLRFTLGMVTKFASRPHAHKEIHLAKKRRTKASQHFVTLDLIPSNALQECVAHALTIQPLQFALYLEHLTRKTSRVK